jgi:hypothetical protein
MNKIIKALLPKIVKSELIKRKYNKYKKYVVMGNINNYR